jgi:hypothetical protein
MQILIHMGNYKTGSTALQHFFYRNRDILKQHRVCYFGYDEPPLCSHASLTYRILIETLEQLGMHEVCIRHPLTAYLQKPAEVMWREIWQRAEQDGAETILISHEGIFCEAYRTFRGLSFVPGEKEKELVWRSFHKRFSELVGKEENDVFPIIFLREKESYLDSQYNQYIKDPWYEEKVQLPSYEEFLKKHPVTLDYDRPLSVIREIYGTDHVLVRRYEPQNDLYEQFLEMIPGLPAGLCREMHLPDANEGNRGLSFDAVAFKKCVLPPAFARDVRIQKILEEYSTMHPDKIKYTWKIGGKNPLYPGLTEEKSMEIMEYVTAKVSQLQENS